MRINGRLNFMKPTVFRNRIRGGLLLLVFALIGLAGTAHGVVLGLQDENSSLQIDLTPGAQLGAINWVIDGVNLLPPVSGGNTDYRQWFWYRVGNNPEASLDTLPLQVSGVTDTDFDGNPDTAVARYTGAPGFKIQVTFTLVGSTPGSGTSDIGEQISIVNTSQSALAISFFEYGDFQLDPPNIGNEVVTFINSNAVQEVSTSGNTLQETVVTPPPTHREATAFPITINKLNDGVPDNLIDNAGAGPGDVTWAYQWDFVLDPGQTVLISKDKQALIPEPSTNILVGLGVIGLMACAKRRRIRRD
jgi:hypothetical protein